MRVSEFHRFVDLHQKRPSFRQTVYTYTFPRDSHLEGLAAQVPEDFKFVFKVTDDITVKKFPNLPSFGARAGLPNPNFLNADLFASAFQRPCEAIRPPKSNVSLRWTDNSGELKLSTVRRSKKIHWLAEPEPHDYPAALSYLTLIYDARRAARLVHVLKSAPVVMFKAKDIFRASDLSLLGTSNSHVEKNRKKIRTGRKLSPVLLVRDASNGKVVIADGYHRVCAVYTFDEDALIPSKIA